MNAHTQHLVDAIASGLNYNQAQAAWASRVIFTTQRDYMGGLIVKNHLTGEERYVEHWDNPDAYAAYPDLLAELF